MAGKVEESFNLNFQANSIHSGSISFGRFETEPLSWERKSSFSHNRFLEEVEKFSKPGSVIEKKAYFEAHFKKKGLFGILPSASHDGSDQTTSENGGSDRLSYQEEVEPNENGHDDTVNIDKSTTLDEAYGNETKLNEGTRNSDESLRTENMIVTEAAGDVKESTLHDHMNSSPKETRPVPAMNSSANNVQIKKTKSSKSSRDHHARSLCKESPRRANVDRLYQITAE